MTDTLDGLRLRPITDGDFDRWVSAFETAFGAEPRADDAADWRQLLRMDRTLAVFDRERIVATSGAEPFRLTVPGGAVAMAGVTAVGVLPTHRRRGLLTGMIRRLLDDARERDEPVAGLWASESSIYGRFGFGWAVSSADLALSQRHSAFVRPSRVTGKVRLLEPEEALRVFPAVYDRARRRTPGMLNRQEARWRAWLLRDPEHWRDGAGPRFVATYEDRGCVSYRIKQDWAGGTPNHTLQVGELYADDSEAYAGLWRWLLDIDLVAEVAALNRPVDDPLALLLADPRRLRTSVHDTLWLRLLDVPAALSARTYGAAGRLTLEVNDRFLPDAAGTFRLDSDGGSGAAARTRSEPDLSLDAETLAAAYLGGTRLSRLARAGRVREHRRGALALADALFTSEPQPWSPMEF